MGLRWGDIEEVRGLHLGHRRGNSKKGGGGSKEGVAGFERSGVAKDLGKSGNGLGKAITKAGPDLFKIGIDLTEPKTRNDFAHVFLFQVCFRAFKVLGLHAIGQG